MDIELPNGWEEKDGGVEDSYYISENQNGVCVGYEKLAPGSVSVWAGDSWSKNKTVDAGCNSKAEAKKKALEFMKEYPEAEFEYDNTGGILYDNDRNLITSI